MDVGELKTAKMRMEESIRNEVIMKINTFVEHTGLSVSGVYIDLAETTALGDTDRSYVVADVRTEVEL